MLPTTGASRRVAIVRRAIRSYRESFGDALRAELARDDIDLLLFHSTPAPDRDVRTAPVFRPSRARSPPERMTFVNNSIVTTALQRDVAALDDSHLDRLREQLGLGEGPVGLFLGTLREDKRLDLLIEAGRALPGCRPRSAARQ